MEQSLTLCTNVEGTTSLSRMKGNCYHNLEMSLCYLLVKAVLLFENPEVLSVERPYAWTGHDMLSVGSIV